MSEKTKAVSSAKKLMWTGAQRLMSQPKTEEGLEAELEYMIEDEFSIKEEMPSITDVREVIKNIKDECNKIIELNKYGI